MHFLLPPGIFDQSGVCFSKDAEFRALSDIIKDKFVIGPNAMGRQRITKQPEVAGSTLSCLRLNGIDCYEEKQINATKRALCRQPETLHTWTYCQPKWNCGFLDDVSRFKSL